MSRKILLRSLGTALTIAVSVTVGAVAFGSDPAPSLPEADAVAADARYDFLGALKLPWECGAVREVSGIL